MLHEFVGMLANHRGNRPSEAARTGAVGSDEPAATCESGQHVLNGAAAASGCVSDLGF